MVSRERSNSQFVVSIVARTEQPKGLERLMEALNPGGGVGQTSNTKLLACATISYVVKRFVTGYRAVAMLE